MPANGATFDVGPRGNSMIERAYGVADSGRRQPSAREDDETAGRRAERLVHDRLRAVLPERIELLPNVRWRQRRHGHLRDGEADLVIADPEQVVAGEAAPGGHRVADELERLR